MNTQRNYKDTVSRMIFRDPGNALSLYNSLNGTHYTDTGMLEFNTLENAIYMGMKNEKLKESCPVLKEYMQYVEKIRENRKRMPLEEVWKEQGANNF